MPTLESPRDGELGVRPDPPEFDPWWVCNGGGPCDREVFTAAGDCRVHGTLLIEVDADGHEVTPR